jgi:hypothetical protein
MKTQKERLLEAYKINSMFHNWMGFMVCDGEEDMLSLRKLVKKIEREAVKQYKLSQAVGNTSSVSPMGSE